MSLRRITEFPAKVLAQSGETITKFDEGFASLVADMFETMEAADGVGLAAAQVGLPLRLFVMDCKGIRIVAANPEIIHTEGEQTGEEGCLSIGKIFTNLTRPRKVILKAQNEKGEWFEQEGEGLVARCLIHETDHCNGKLFIDHLSFINRAMVVKRFQTKRKR